MVSTRLLSHFASTPFTMGSAPSCGRALAPCYGSHLLSLKLPSARSRATPRGMPPAGWRDCMPATHRTLHVGDGPLRVPLATGGPYGGFPRRAISNVLARSSNCDLDGHCVPPQNETSTASHSADQRFLIAVGRSAPSSLVRREATPAGGAGELCPGEPGCCQPAPREPGAPAAPDLSPVTRNYLGADRGGGCGLASAAPCAIAHVLSKNRQQFRPRPPKKQQKFS